MIVVCKLCQEPMETLRIGRDGDKVYKCASCNLTVFQENIEAKNGKSIEIIEIGDE